ncbi:MULTISPECIES: sugar transferase [unclassified Akkermansia]|uniref:sugar transferase n=2 Tax=Akkermansia TaxID=239934 RepID=UPI00079C2868|nr:MULTISPECIES: sugar transferase [unclassified Akkermansia]KXT52579.1 exopolysaccharide biosynthesis polyprenyl glycosylphosphotransferase [Akkermansia sp. KLE1797]KXU52822.1 exopolysaccharide biosynthesis polyprenyl glycosylphosphotransferase [Akkermansia sp. KLE1798]KZA04216.1 exopolysaccharide biosynthesis polyprenyl glycosylphosphotransferase [Akkermansia sp. KLE1605]
MLIQNADRTTYGINKMAVTILAFVVFMVVGFISWSSLGVQPEPWRLRTLVLAPLTMSLLLYFCCDQFGVYYRCMTLSGTVWRLALAYACFVVLSSIIWKYLVPFSGDPVVQILAYLLTFLGVLWLCIFRFRSEKKLEEEAPMLLVGAPEHVDTFLKQMKRDRVDIQGALTVISPKSVDSVTTRDILIRNCISKVVFLPEGVDASVAECLTDLCGKMGVDFYASMMVRMPTVHKTYFGVMGEVRMLVYKSTPIPYTTSWQIKKALDWFGSLALLVITSPLWLVAAAGIKLSAPGSVFYRQKRSGLYGREFGMWKFRTMYQDAEKRLDEVKASHGNEMDGPIFKLENDPRVFPFGRILCKFSIDELPQLINVLKGEMSLVGPRPLPVYETEAFTSDAHRRRLSVLPGVTGYWQIAGRSNIKEFEKLVELDMYYIDHWSLWLDVKLLLKTVPAVLFARGAK